MKQIFILAIATIFCSCSDNKDYYTIHIYDNQVILYDGTKEVHRESLDSGSELSKAILKDNE